MAGEKRKLVDSASIGSPPKKILESIETIQLVIHNFKDLTEKRGESIQSRVLKAHGYEWMIEIYPKGHPKSSSETEYVSYILKYAGDRKYKPAVRFTIRCKGSMSKCSNMKIFSEETSMVRGASNYLKRDDIIANYMEEDGSLKIEFDIQIASESKLVWYPKELQQQEILTELYHEASETADVVFNIGGMEYHAHKNILSRRAKTLFELSKDYNDDDREVAIPISDMKGEIFQKLLEFVYTVKTPEVEDDGLNTAIEILLAANRFDCTQLKLYIESVIVDNFLTPTIAAKMLILGDSYSCALLKEAAMNLYASDPIAVRESEGWTEIIESNRLLDELLESVSHKLVSYKNNGHDATTTTTTTVDNLDVTSLREQLQESKLEVDGNRSMLVARLKKAHQQQEIIYNI
jgi:speckle-type POZ protein